MKISSTRFLQFTACATLDSRQLDILLGFVSSIIVRHRKFCSDANYSSSRINHELEQSQEQLRTLV